MIYSGTRGPGSEFGDLERPSFKVEYPEGADPTRFLEIVDAKTVRIPDPELIDIQNYVQHRVRSAYSFTVVLHPKVGEKRLDIGKFEQMISVTAGGITHHLRVNAMVNGPAWLLNGTEIDLGSFSAETGLDKLPRDIITQDPSLELALVPDNKPSKFTFGLKKLADSNGQGRYQLLITVPPGKGYGKVQGEAVLELKGPNPQRMRIPIVGSGVRGGGG
jgi:hypothetical protein